MKSLLIAAAMIFSTSATAGTIMWPLIEGVPVNNLCDAGSTFQTIAPVVEYTGCVAVPAKGQGETYEPATVKCSGSELVQKSVSKNYNATYCTEYGSNEADAGICVGEIAKEAKVYGNTFSVPVWDTRGEVYGQKGSFNYTVPACAK